MDKIKINDIVSDLSTNASGFSLYCILKTYFENNTPVEVSFSGCSAMSTSFFNSSFGAFIEDFGFDTFKRIIKIVEIQKSQAIILKRYFSYHTH